VFDVDESNAGFQFRFIEFPYELGNYTVPPIKIVVTTPSKNLAKQKNLYSDKLIALICLCYSLYSLDTI